MHRIIHIALFLGFIIGSQQIFAQGFGSIFRAGLNLSTMSGPVTSGPDGDLEKIGYASGFHIGVGARFHFDYLKKYGIGLEGNYSQKGSTINYEGTSFYVFRNTSGTVLPTVGVRRSNLNVSHTYIDIPLYAYARITKGIEVNGGVYGAFLVKSVGTGDLTYSGTNPLINEFTIQQNHNYFKDRLIDYTQPLQGEFINMTIASQQFQVPSVQTAYAENETYEGNLYKIFDFGLIGGVSFYLNQGLYIGLRAQYGLSNLVNQDMQLRYDQLGPNNRAQLSTDKRSNLTFQASIGFSF